MLINNLFICFIWLIMTINHFFRWFERTSLHRITERCLVSLVAVQAHHLLQLLILRFRRLSPTLSLISESLSRLHLVHHWFLRMFLHRFLRMFRHRFLGLIRHPHIMIMFQRRHLHRWRPRFIPICLCCRVLLMLFTPSRTFSLSQAEKVYLPQSPTDRMELCGMLHFYCAVFL